MGEHSKDPVVWGAMMARDKDDMMAGYQAYRAIRKEGKTTTGRTLVGPVRETYAEAAQDARDAADNERSES